MLDESEEGSSGAEDRAAVLEDGQDQFKGKDFGPIVSGPKGEGRGGRGRGGAVWLGNTNLLK